MRLTSYKNGATGQIQGKVIFEQEIGEIDMCQAIEEMKRDSMEEGMQQGARKTALNLQKIGMPAEQIAHMVGYSSEQVSQWLLRDRKMD